MDIVDEELQTRYTRGLCRGGEPWPEDLRGCGIACVFAEKTSAFWPAGRGRGAEREARPICANELAGNGLPCAVGCALCMAAAQV